ncbi:ATP-binding protein, partial [Streptomyces sp. NPDC006324]
MHLRVGQCHHGSGDVAMSEDEKNPARQIISDYAREHFRYFRTVDGTVYAQKNGHPVA